MPEEKIIDLPPLAVQAITDLYEVSANGALSSRESRLQMLNFMISNIATAPYAPGDLIFADSSASLGKIPDTAIGEVLLSGGVGISPAYGKVGLATHVDGVLPTGNGGTGNTTYTDGQLLIGKTDGTLAAATLTEGAGVTITNGDGTIQISSDADVNVEYQDVYNNTTATSGNANTDIINGFPYTISSTTEVSRPFSSMTAAQGAVLEDPINGGGYWENDTGKRAINVGTPASPIWRYYAYENDIPEESSVYASCSLQGNATYTTISGAATPVKITGVFAPGFTKDAIAGADGRMTYTGTVAQTIQVQAKLSATLDAVSATCAFYIALNGVIIPTSKTVIDIDGSSPAFRSLSLLSPVAFSNSGTDYVEIFAENITSSDDILVDGVNFTFQSLNSFENVDDQVVISWESSTSPVNVLGSSTISAAGGLLTYIGDAEKNVITAFGGSTTPVGLQAGANITFDPDGTINAAGGGGSVSLNDAYINGANITATPSKPIKFISNTFTTKPDIIMESTPNGLSNAVISSLKWFGRNDVSETIQYATIRTVIDSPSDGSESAFHDFSAYSNGLSKIYIRYDGGSDTIICASTIRAETISSNSLVTTDGSSNLVDGALTGDVTTSGLAATLATVNGDVGTFGDADNIPQITVDGKGRITAVSNVAPAQIFTSLAKTLIPTTGFVGPFTTVWSTLQGSNIVGAGEFDIGEMIEIDVTGNVSVNIPGPNVDIGSAFRVSFGSAFTETSSNIPLGNSSTRLRNFALKFKITRIDLTTVIASSSGYYYDNSSVNKSLNFPTLMNSTTASYTYDQSLSYAIDLQYSNGNSFVGGMDFICQNLSINKYS